MVPSSPFAFSPSQRQGLFQWVGSSHQVAKELELQHQFFQWIFRVDFLAVQGTLKSSRAPQFESVNSSALCLLYGPILTPVYGYWKNYSSDYMDLCWKSDDSDKTVEVCHSFPSKEQVSFNCMAVVTLSTVIWVQENKICNCLHFFPIYLPWSDGIGCHDLRFLNAEF